MGSVAPPPHQVPLRWRTWQAAFAGVIGGVLMSLLMYLFIMATPSMSEFVSIAGIFILPVSMGAITLCFSSAEQQANKSYRIFAPWLTVTLLYLILLLAYWETLICLIMLAPVAYLGASVGGALAGTWLHTKNTKRVQRGTLGCFIVLPLLLSPLEDKVLPTPTEFVTAQDSIIIDASAQHVWTTLLNVPDIRDEELRSSFSHRMGLPRPRAALMTGSGVGAVRDLYWDDGVQFRELIKVWEPARLLVYDVDVSPARIALQRLDTHVVIGDRYFTITQGRYQLMPLADGRTELQLSTSYRITTRINAYGRFWADRTLDDFHNVVLALIKQRAERAG